ncbi:MAG TPA: protein kinase [Vicinamibacterales bacterium]|nr:protein kinase [Vicinamibacterales bacterium]
MRCPSCGHEPVSPGGRCAVCGFLAAGDSAEATAAFPPLRHPGAASVSSTTASSAPTGFTPPPAATAHQTSADGPLAAGQPFGSRYHIIRVLGAGGMGVVYHAWDGELGVAVALKVIRPEVLRDAGAAGEVERRFKRELVLARQVTHKHVVRIHDLGEVNGVKYLTMPFVEGEDLASVLKREGKLPVPRAIGIARQVASGLAAAHEVGVVHRDLKPENIMLEADGDALIMDFGISRSVSGTGTATQLGAVLGTLEYMAPEQAQGVAVDHRADIYSFGLVLYDMLVGRQRLAARDNNAMSEMMSRMQQPPAGVRAIDATIPEPLERIVMRCLAASPDARYQSTGELLKDLEALTPDGHLLQPAVAAPATRVSRPLVAVAAALIVALAGIAAWLATAGRAPADPGAPAEPVSVLIANFENRASDEQFDDGLIEQALAVGIEGASFVTVFPRRDALRAARALHPEKPMDEEVARLVSMSRGIDVVVAGAISYEAGKYRLALRMVDPRDARPKLEWNTLIASKDQVLNAVGQAAAKVRNALGDRADDRLTDAETFTAASIDAAHAYARAQELQWAGKPDEAIAQYQRAIELDPDLGRAYSGLAALYNNRGRRAEAQAYYDEALKKLDRMTEREKLRTRGAYHLFTRNSQAAINALTELVTKYPADTAGLTNLAVAYFYRREMARALTEGEKPVKIYPEDVVSRTNLALFAMYAGDFERAEREAAKVLELSKGNAFKGYVAQALSHLARGNTARAREIYEQLAGVSDVGRSYSADGLADVALYEGRLTDAERILTEGIDADEAKNATDAAARKRIVLAETRLARGDRAAAVATAAAAQTQSADASVQFRAARLFAVTGQADRAKPIAEALGSRLTTDPQIYARLIEGEIALAQGRPRDGALAFTAAQELADTWLGRFALGRALLQLNDREALHQALEHFEACLRRSGEATAVFLDDIPSYHYLPPVHYHVGLAQAAIGNAAAAAQAFGKFVELKEGGDEQGLVADARRRLSAR